MPFKPFSKKPKASPQSSVDETKDRLGSASSAGISSTTPHEQSETEPAQATTSTQNAVEENKEEKADFKRGPRFWLVYLSVSLVCFVSAIDTTILSTALPTITENVHGSANDYVWVANCFSIAQTAVQPLFGQLCNIFGRRWPMIGCMALFLIGTGIAGGANDISTIIAGRTILGLGSGGIFMMGELITADLVPLRFRGQYLGIVMSSAAVGSLLGPLIGGAIAESNWRWVFWMNLPIGGVAFVVLFIFLRLKHVPETSWKRAIVRVDIIGNTLFIASITSLLYGLISGGVNYRWNTYHVIVPIVLGGLGWIAFHIQQFFVAEPTVPPRLFSNRTSNVGFFIAWNSSVLVQWISYFLPLYFQGPLQQSPIRSGVNLLPTTAFLVPAAILAGGLMSKTGKYRFLHFAGFALLAISFGLYTLFTERSSKAEYICFQIISAFGLGLPISTVLPSIQAGLPEADVATSTGTYQFVRSFGFVWGITIPSIIFNNAVNSRIGNLNSPDLAATIANGGAYAYVVGGQINQLAPELRSQLITIYVQALKQVWWAGLGFSLVGFLAPLLSKDIPLRTDLENEFGLEDDNKNSGVEGEPKKAEATEIVSKPSST